MHLPFFFTGPYSGILFGITNTMAQIPGFLTPVIVSNLTTHGTLTEWYRVFNIAGVVFLAGQDKNPCTYSDEKIAVSKGMNKEMKTKCLLQVGHKKLFLFMSFTLAPP